MRYCRVLRGGSDSSASLICCAVIPSGCCPAASDARHIVSHTRVTEPRRVTVATGRPADHQARDPHPEEGAILQAAPELADYISGLKKRGPRLVVLALRQLFLNAPYHCAPYIARQRIHAV